jgi:cytochrome c biogenesis protein CcdA
MSALGRAVAATAVMALGFVAVFGTFGLLAVSVANTAQRYMPYATVVIGIALAALGVWQLTGHEVKVPIRDPLARGSRWGPTAALGSMFGYGVSYALASLSCTVGPFLAITGIGVGSAGGGLPAVMAYTAGLTLVVGTLAVAAALAGSSLWRGCAGSCPTSTESAAPCSSSSAPTSRTTAGSNCGSSPVPTHATP